VILITLFNQCGFSMKWQSYFSGSTLKHRGETTTSKKGGVTIWSTQKNSKWSILIYNWSWTYNSNQGWTYNPKNKIKKKQSGQALQTNPSWKEIIYRRRKSKRKQKKIGQHNNSFKGDFNHQYKQWRETATKSVTRDRRDYKKKQKTKTK